MDMESEAVFGDRRPRGTRRSSLALQMGSAFLERRADAISISLLRLLPSAVGRK